MFAFVFTNQLVFTFGEKDKCQSDINKPRVNEGRVNKEMFISGFKST